MYLLQQSQESRSRSSLIASARFALALLLSLTMLPAGVLAAQGDLDTTFGAGGKVTTDFNKGDDAGNAVTIQPDGKVVVAGQAASSNVPSSGVTHFAVARYNTDGSLDTSFGTGGKVLIDFGGAELATAVAIQADAKIVVGGVVAKNGQSDFALARLNQDGSLDVTFGTGGRVTTNFSANDMGRALVIQPNGMIIVGGPVNGLQDFGLARYNTNGTLDSSFGTNGKVITDFNNQPDLLNALALQPDGKIVAAGIALNFASFYNFGLARYNPDGSLDGSFGTGGKVVTDFFGFDGEDDEALAVAVQPDGRIIAAGTANLRGDFGLARYNTNGTLDSSFGTNGKVTTDFNGKGDVCTGMVLQPDGKVVVAGIVNITAPPPNSPNVSGDFGLARYNTNGTLDSSFGSGGKVITDFGGSMDQANGVALQADGKIVAAGYTDNTSKGTGLDFALARYAGATPPPQPAARLRFSLSSYTVGEADGHALITVQRITDTSGTSSVDYLTIDGTAQQRSDYMLSSGTLVFAPGEDSKSFTIPIIDDAYTEGTESLTLTLTNARGASIDTTGFGFARLQIQDNDPSAAISNPIDDNGFFVRQHYLDFLSREPDPGGLAFWTSELNKCGSDEACLRQRRIDVSDAFQFEAEYQNTAGFIYRIYKSSYGTRPSFYQFMPDRARVVGGPSLDASKTSYAELFTQRTAFTAQYPLDLTPEQYVNKLNANTGGSLTQAECDALVNGLKSGAETRGTALRKVAENAAFTDREYNSAFVVSLYFGYLRRDAEPGGFEFWLAQINRFPLRNVAGQHALVCSFITSKEYQERFGSIVTHTNGECPH